MTEVQEKKKHRDNTKEKRKKTEKQQITNAYIIITILNVKYIIKGTTSSV